MKKQFIFILFICLSGVGLFAQSDLLDLKIIVRKLDQAKTQLEIDKILEDAKVMKLNYLRNSNSDDEMLNQKVSEAHSWFGKIITLSNYRRQKIFYERQKGKNVATLLLEIKNINLNTEQRQAIAEAILAKRNELSKNEIIALIDWLTKNSDIGLRDWVYNNLSSLVSVKNYGNIIERGLFDSHPGVVANTVNVISENNMNNFYHHFYRTIQIDYDAAVGNSALALIKIGILGSASIPFLTNILLIQNHIRVNYARSALIAIFFDSINVLFSGNFGCPIPLGIN